MTHCSPTSVASHRQPRDVDRLTNDSVRPPTLTVSPNRTWCLYTGNSSSLMILGKDSDGALQFKSWKADLGSRKKPAQDLEVTINWIYNPGYHSLLEVVTL